MPSAELDHVMPIADGGDLWDESNMGALCKICHDLKSAAETSLGTLPRFRGAPPGASE